MLHQKLNSKEAKDLAIDLFKKVELPEPEEFLIHILTKYLAVRSKGL